MLQTAKSLQTQARPFFTNQIIAIYINLVVASYKKQPVLICRFTAFINFTPQY